MTEGGSLQNDGCRTFYVYKWFFKDTGEIFHIGKGCGNRYKEAKISRNAYFRNIVSKYPDRVGCEILVGNLTESEAFAMEKDLIRKYKEIGQCKTNFHEGGCGGNTGNYDNPERSRKLREHAKARIGSKNGMYGRHHSDAAKRIMSLANIGKKLTPEHIESLRRANTGRVKTEEELEKLRNNRLKGIPLSRERYVDMMYSDSSRYFVVRYRNDVVYCTISYKKLVSFGKSVLKVSNTIVSRILSGNYVPKFARNKWLADVSIVQHSLDESVSMFLGHDEIEKQSFTDDFVSALKSVQPYHYNKTEKWISSRGS